MKGCWFFILLISWLNVFSQQEEDHAELMALNEDDIEMKEAELIERSNAPKININSVKREELKALQFITEEQVEALYKHIDRFGKLLNKYELQSIDGWDPDLIRKILPLVVVEDDGKQQIKELFGMGRSMFLLRITPGWFVPKDSSYAGNMGRVMSRYQYTSRFFRGGILIEKDPGEKKLTDHLSFHVEYDLKHKWIKKIIAGDYTVSYGQGLIQWQGYGFGRGGDVQTVQKPMASMKGYHGANEFNFHRGVAAQFQFKKINASIFSSYVRLDGNLDGDTLRSISSAGLHRTGTEIGNSNIASLLTTGMNISYPLKHGKISFNGVHYTFDQHYQKRQLPYNLYSINSGKWSNISIDHQYSYRNIHLFGELAADQHFSFAFIQGVILSLHRSSDLSVVYRNISAKYQSMFSRAFTENNSVNNEQGIYLNYTYKWKRFQLSVIADHYVHPWVKFGVDAPSSGALYGFQSTWNISRSIEWINRFRYEEDEKNVKALNTNSVVLLYKYSFRSHLNYVINKEQQLRFRMESIVLNKNNNKSGGFISFVEFLQSVKRMRATVVCRLQYFDVDDFDSRIYAFERDITYGMSIPFYTDKGYRYYFVIQCKPAPRFTRRLLKDRAMNLSLKWSQSLQTTAIKNNSNKSELKIQFIIYNTH